MLANWAAGEMYFLPYRNLELHCALSAEEATQVLQNAVEPKRWLRFRSGSRPFEGTVKASEFRIQRIITYRNSFLPQISGTIRPTTTGSRISIAMRLHAFVAVFMVVWFGGVLFALATFAAGALAGRGSGADLLPALGMLLFGWLLVVGGFSFEAKKAERLLIALFSS